jgi:hypothetical protein
MISIVGFVRKPLLQKAMSLRSQPHNHEQIEFPQVLLLSYFWHAVAVFIRDSCFRGL